MANKEIPVKIGKYTYDGRENLTFTVPTENNPYASGYAMRGRDETLDSYNFANQLAMLDVAVEGAFINEDDTAFEYDEKALQKELT